jgi:hypothetical protein
MFQPHDSICADILNNENRLTVTQAWWEIMSLIRENGFKLDTRGCRRRNQSKPLGKKSLRRQSNIRAPGVVYNLPGWEWSADAGDVGTHLHRNVIYGGDDLP